MEELDRRERELIDLLQRCIPPVDQHRHDLQRVRTERERLRTGDA
jgi:hypothetical protein